MSIDREVECVCCCVFIVFDREEDLLVFFLIKQSFFINAANRFSVGHYSVWPFAFRIAVAIMLS